MPRYHKLGNIPPKRHTIHKSNDDKFYYEELFGTIGFDGMSSLIYHTHRPTQVKKILKSYDVGPKVAVENNMKSLMLNGFNIKPFDDFLDSRKCILMNNDCQIILAAPKQSLTRYYYKNTDSDEVIFIHKGSGKENKMFTRAGNIPNLQNCLQTWLFIKKIRVYSGRRTRCHKTQISENWGGQRGAPRKASSMFCVWDCAASCGGLSPRGERT